MKKASFTGVTGQVGSFLAEFLLAKGHEVHGIKRQASLFKAQRVDHIYEDPQVKNAHFHLHCGDLCDSSKTRKPRPLLPLTTHNKTCRLPLRELSNSRPSMNDPFAAMHASSFVPLMQAHQLAGVALGDGADGGAASGQTAKAMPRELGPDVICHAFGPFPGTAGMKEEAGP